MCDCERPVVFCSRICVCVCVCVCELALVLQDIPQRPMPKRNWHGAGLEASGGLQEGILHYSVYLLHTYTLPDTCNSLVTAPELGQFIFFLFCLLSFYSISPGITRRTQLHYEVTLTSYAPASQVAQYDQFIWALMVTDGRT